MPHSTMILGAGIIFVSALLLLAPVVLATWSVVSRPTDRVRRLARIHLMLAIPVTTFAFALGATRLVIALMVAAFISAIVASLPSYRVVHRIRHTIP